MITVFNSRVRYSEADRNGNLSVKSLFDYLQDCCIFQSEDLGEGVARLQKRHRAWLLVSWNIEVVRMPRLGEKIQIQTWPYHIKRFFAQRGHAVENEEGEILIKGNSIWSFVDTEQNRAVNIPQEEIDLYKPEDRMDIPIGKRKIVCRGDYETRDGFRILLHQIDSNGHTNNSQYIMMAADTLPESFSYRKIRVEYSREAVLGDLVVPRIYHQDNGCIVDLTSEEGKRFAAVEFSL